MSPRVIIALIRRDLNLFLADRRSVIISFVLPIAMASFFGFLFGGRGGGGEPQRVKVQVVDRDDSRVSRAMVIGLVGDDALAVESVSLERARAAVRDGDVMAAVVVPPGFGDAAVASFAGRADPPSLELLYDPSRAAELGLLRGLLTRHVTGAVAEGFGGPPPRLPYVLDEQPVTAGPDVAYNAYAHSFAGMGVQFVLMAALEAGVAILVQRQRGLWKRLRAAPLSRSGLLGARALSSALISMSILVVLFGFGALAFGVRVAGSVVGLLGVCAALSLMAGSFGLLVASFGRTPEATRGISIFVTLVIVMLGGAWVPSFLFPGWLQDVAAFTPTRWAMSGLDGTLWRGYGLRASLLPISILLAFALAFAVLAIARFDWDER